MSAYDKLTDILKKAKSIAAPAKIKDIKDITDWDHNNGPMPADHPHRQKVVDYISELSRDTKTPGARANARRLYETHIAGTPGIFTAGVTPDGKSVKKSINCAADDGVETLEMSANGQWSLKKASEQPNKVEGRDDKIVSPHAASEVPNKVAGAEDKI